MPSDDEIRITAEQNGVQQEFWDNFGNIHATSRGTNVAILNSLGVVPGEDVARAESVPPVMVVLEGEPERIPGTDLWTPNLQLGYHSTHVGGRSMRLIVCPKSAVRLTGKRAGLGVTLYGVRSGRNWGCGDFRDLRDLSSWAAEELCADFIALNPLHAIHNRIPYNQSPYLPNSIFYRNWLYLDVEAVPGYSEIRAAFETPETLAEMARLRATDIVQYEAVAALKRRALEMIFAREGVASEAAAWIAAEGELLRAYATYCALDEDLHAADPEVWVWPQWPAAYQDPESREAAVFAVMHEREIAFHGWLQWLVDGQIAEAQKHALAAGMGIGLYHDLALATDRCGSDLWAHRPFFVKGARVGSPPDGFSPSGQDWSFPPPNQVRHLEDGYRLYAESIAKSMRHGGALRIDHVMRLFRLYWIPEGHTAAEGAYVRDRAKDLVRILALESVRSGAAIVGEDLGTVEDEVRETLAAFGVLSYRLLIFEQNAEGFKAPEEYPEGALTSTTTHDLPTVAGFWTGEDIEARLQAGTVDEASYEAQKADRVRDRQRLLDALFKAGLLPEAHERDAAALPELTAGIHEAVLGFLAKTPCAMWLVNQEDMTLEPYQQNLPGTTAEYPNWSRKMRWSVEELRTLPVAVARAAMVRDLVVGSGRESRREPVT